MITRADIVAEARRWVGVPFAHQGRVFSVGVDCVGLPICVSRELGLVSPDFDVNNYPRSPDGRSLLLLCDTHMRRITRKEMQPGDVIAIRWGRDPQHLGILGDYLYGGLSMIHAYSLAGKVVEHCLDENTLKRFVAAYSLLEAE